MSTISNARRNVRPEVKESPPSALLRAVLALIGGIVLFFVLLMALAVGYDFYHAGKIYPGVWMGGIDLSGLVPEQAAALLSERLTYPKTGKIVFQDGQGVWVARPADLGLSLDLAASVQTAYDLGRQGNPVKRVTNIFAAWYTGRSLAPRLTYDERQARAYLTGIAAQVDRPTIEASLDIEGTTVNAVAGQIGRQIDISATLEPLTDQMRSMNDGMVPLAVVETPPQILDASQPAEQARTILAEPVVLQIPDAAEGDPGPWALDPAQVASFLTIEQIAGPQGPQYQLSLKSGALRRFLDEQAPGLARNPANARFIFNDDTSQLEVLEPAVIGRALNVEASLQTITEKLLQGGHTIDLTFDYAQPEVNSDATGEQLGITELVSSHTSYFRGSSAERMQNIEAAAARFHGLLVPPGATFSMADAMGDVSLDTGYAEALIILGGRTIKGVGGGVCQVSTTLFRTAFLGGYPIVERHPHAYRVGYYEQTANGWDQDLAGLDATVFVPQVDFKFENNTPYWLLMETYVNKKAGRITWKFYSTSDGREVNWETSGPQNIVQPPDPVYEENPNLAPGEIKQVDWAADGADVIVTREVRHNGEVLFRDQIVTHYEPWGDVYQVGPGTDINNKD
jgi:vancomycin resistance protein YoaR